VVPAAAVGDLDQCGYETRPAESRRLDHDGDNTADDTNLEGLPVLVVLDLPVVASDYAEQIPQGLLTFKDCTAIPPMSVRSVSTGACIGVADR